MAKFFTILLIWVYAFSATGATVHLHYCCGKLQKLAMQDEDRPSSAGHDCPLCLKHNESKKNTDCNDSESCGSDLQSQNHCQNAKVDAKKTTGDHLPGNDKNSTKVYPLELLAFTLIGFAGLPIEIHRAAQAVDAPPPTGAPPLFIQHCTYLI